MGIEAAKRLGCAGSQILVDKQSTLTLFWKLVNYGMEAVMKFNNRIKRISDILEKLGVASLAVALFQSNPIGFWIGFVCLVLSLALTKEAS